MVRDYHWIDPEFVSLVAAHRLDELPGRIEIDAAQGLMTAHRGRVTMRRELPGEESCPVVFVKRETWTPLRYRLRHLFRGRGLWTKARAEFDVLQQLREAGFRCPRPIACVQRGRFHPKGVLVLAELAGTGPLSAYLASSALGEDRQRREGFFTTLGREIARLHAAGFHQPDLYSNHIHVAEVDDDWRFSFLDFQRSERRRWLRLRHRIRGLAALLATVSPRWAGERDWEVFFDAYLADSGLEEQISRIRSDIDERVTRLLKRRKIWEIRESDTRVHRAVERLETVQAGKMWIDRCYRSRLEQSGLANFEAMMSTCAGHQLRALPDRENWRIDLPHAETEHQGAFLKKHHVRTLATRLRSRLGAGVGETPGRVEARNVARLARGGIAAMRLIAFGEKLHADGLLESFVLTEELLGYTQLDHFLRQRFPPRDRRTATPRDATFQRLLSQVATVAAKFHKLGYNHRDLYCCHFFIKERHEAEFHVNLIDLQRVQHRRRFRKRWLVKDLAQLSYSAPRERVSGTDKMAFMKRYLGVRKLRPCDKRFIRRILAKHRQMETRLGPHP